MKDEDFDKIIKDKMEDMEGGTSIPSDLVGLHDRLDAQTPPLAWHRKYRERTVMGVIFIITTLLLLTGQWHLNEKGKGILLEEISRLKDRGTEIDILRSQIDSLKDVRPDTVNIVTIAYQDLPQERPVPKRDVFVMESGMMLLGNVDRIPSQILKGLERSGSIIKKGGKAYLVASGTLGPLPPKDLADHSSLYSKVADIVTYIENDDTPLTEKRPSGKINIERKVSGKVAKALRRHYHKGIGLNIGPSIDIYHGRYKEGKSDPSIGVSILADILFSPSFSLETGGRFTIKDHKVTDRDRLTLINEDRTDNGLGELKGIDAELQSIEVPINLKFRYPISPDTRSIGSLGYSALITFRQKLEYGHAYVPMDMTNGDPDLTINSSETIRSKYLYHGSFNISMGVDHLINNGNQIEATLFYRHGLDKLGILESEASFFGIRGVYWFNIK